MKHLNHSQNLLRVVQRRRIAAFIWIIYDQHADKYVGFVNYGAAIVEPDEQPATEALVF